MIEKKLADLIQREIDGALAADERAELRELLRTNPRAAEFSAQLQGVSRVLTGLHSQDTPPTLKPSIMRAVEARGVRRPERSIAEKTAAWFQAISPRGAFAGGLVAGLALALVAFTVLLPASLIRDADVAGTALLNESVPVVAPTASVPVAAGEVSGVLTMEASGRFQIATVVLSSGSAEHTAVLTYPADQVRLAAVRPDNEVSVPVAAGNGRVEIRQRGSTRLQLFFTVLETQPAPLHLSVRNADGTEHSADIAFAEPASR
jgi:anti-sigma factor RsiW